MFGGPSQMGVAAQHLIDGSEKRISQFSFEHVIEKRSSGESYGGMCRGAS